MVRKTEMKNVEIKNPTARTEPAPKEEEQEQELTEAQIYALDLDGGPVVHPLGVAISGNEKEALDFIVRKYNIRNRHTLLKVAVKAFIEGVLSGDIDVSDYFEASPTPKMGPKKR